MLRTLGDAEKKDDKNKTCIFKVPYGLQNNLTSMSLNNPWRWNKELLNANWKKARCLQSCVC